MSDEAPPQNRLLRWYRVDYEYHGGGDFSETQARNEAEAASNVFQLHMCPGIRITRVEFATWHPDNRAMMGLGTAEERPA